jgi:hypothetical protein
MATNYVDKILMTVNKMQDIAGRLFINEMIYQDILDIKDNEGRTTARQKIT